MISETFCILPWIQVSCDTRGRMRICCTAATPSIIDEGLPINLKFDSDFTKHMNNDYMKSVRLKMLKGEKVKACEKCYINEENDFHSKRQNELSYWRDIIDIESLVDNTEQDGSIEAKIHYFDLALGNTCNLACVMCHPGDSSRWIKDAKQMPSISHLKDSLKDIKNTQWYENNPNFWKKFNDQIENIKLLYLIGGEPSLISKCDEIMDNLIDTGYSEEITIRYATNGTGLTETLMNRFHKFKKVKLYYSLDGIGEVSNYIRYPSTWTDHENNLRYLDLSPENVEVIIETSISALNVYYFPDFIKWKMRQNYRKINSYSKSAGLINSHLVSWPHMLDMRVLPTGFKSAVTGKYNEFIPWLIRNWRKSTGVDDSTSYSKWLNSDYGVHHLRGIIQIMNSEDKSYLLNETGEFIKEIDRVRGTDFKNTFKEMSTIW